MLFVLWSLYCVFVYCVCCCVCVVFCCIVFVLYCGFNRVLFVLCCVWWCLCLFVFLYCVSLQSFLKEYIVFLTCMINGVIWFGLCVLILCLVVLCCLFVLCFLLSYNDFCLDCVSCIVFLCCIMFLWFWYCGVNLACVYYGGFNTVFVV